MMNLFYIRQFFVLGSLILLAILFLKKKQDKRLNWAVFYSGLYVLIVLPIANYLGVLYGYWSFSLVEDNAIHLPYDLYFVWVIIWGVLPTYFFKGKYTIYIALVLYYLDIILMNQLETYRLIELNPNWAVIDLLLIIVVFLPGYFWSYCSYNNIHLAFRSGMQVVVMGCILIIGIPFIGYTYGLIETLAFEGSMIDVQLLFIIVFPALIGVYDLVKIGQGTPFPYDPTKRLVRTGVYAYIQNPIQWSFTLTFIVLSYFHQSAYLLIGVLASVLYVYGISDPQEKPDMHQRFGGQWENYNRLVPKWYFQWKPQNSPIGQIYYDSSCGQCTALGNWLKAKSGLNLQVLHAVDYPEGKINQLTYIDHYGNEFKSVKAFAKALDHINLGYAVLGWFIRFPVLSFVFQSIVDALGFGQKIEDCAIE